VVLTAKHYDGQDLKLWRRSELERRFRRRQWLYDRKLGGRRQAADLEMCRRSWVYWTSNYAWIWAPKVLPPECREMPFVPWPAQVEAGDWILERTRLGEVAAIPKSRDLGISYLCCNLIVWMALFEPNFQALMGSRVEDLVDRKGDRDTLFAKVRKTLLNQPGHILEDGGIVHDKHLVIELRRGATITGQATHENFGASGRSSVVFIDEMARIPHRIAQSMWLALETVAASIWAIWNPGPKDHITYYLHNGEAERLPSRMLHPMDWRANPTRPDDFIESLITPRGRLSRPYVESAHCLRYGYVITGLIYAVDWERTLFEYAEADFTRQHVCVGGWDFGTGESLLVNVLGRLEYMRPDPVLWIDECLQWGRATWRQAAIDSRQSYVERGHTANRVDWGDPAGKNAESDQSSWESNLRAAGIPLECLPGAFNTREALEMGYREVQIWIDEGRLRVHPRARALRTAMESWRRDLPEGVEVGQVSRTYVPPRKDEHSHAGQALAYLVMGAKRWLSTTHVGTSRPSGGEEKRGREQLSDSAYIDRMLKESRRRMV
jgi:hypothetical protein